MENGIKIFICFLLGIFPNLILSQNLVPNSGFEKHHKTKVESWLQPCCSFNHFEIKNPDFCHMGKCRNGLCLWKYDVSEYLSVKLTDKLKAGQQYRVESFVFYDSILDECRAEAEMKIGFLFSKTPIITSYKRRIFTKPQIEFTAEKTPEWIQYSDVFTANGDEEYLSIGHFLDTIKNSSLPNYKTINLYLSKVEKVWRLMQERDDAMEAVIKKGQEKYPELEKMNDVLKLQNQISRSSEYQKLSKKNSQAIKFINNEINEVKEHYNQDIIDATHEYTSVNISIKTIPTCRVRYYFDDIIVVPDNEVYETKNEVEEKVNVVDTATVVNDINVFENIEIGQKIVLNNVYFETNSATLLSESSEELDKLVALLEEKSGMEIEISGHTDNIGKADKNVRLSEARAKSVSEYLFEKGIRKDRITFHGYGWFQPIADNNSEEGRAKNRRVEFKVLKK